ncbi:MAG: Gfo/Idh/MocA family oxidoreductase [Kiritimatiellae bacterium]|nr:Gfo/Idh/MocA family oxidoreductase [Kiritimatiellia bacterium]
MNTVRMGIVGLGMGGSHARKFLKGSIARAKLTAVCDLSPERLAPFEQTTKVFARPEDLFDSGLIDAVIVATPHYSHATVGIAALRHGLHVLVEKPISAHKADALRLIAAHRNKKQVFAAMFNERTQPCYITAHTLVRNGELGELRRLNWISTDWFRTDAYYARSGWRATWKGEGGGVLLNQCPHHLDLFQWIAGMPIRVRANCFFGKYHAIEVEDDVTAFMEYSNGATGVFIATTGEAPGTNRMEITGDRGRLIVEHNTIQFTRNTVPMSDYCRKAKGAMATPDVWLVTIPVKNTVHDPHAAILQNFTDAILDGVPLIAPAEEGLRSLELANAMVYSSIKNKCVDLPLNAKRYAQLLRQLIATPPSVKTKSRSA